MRPPFNPRPSNQRHCSAECRKATRLFDLSGVALSFVAKERQFQWLMTDRLWDPHLVAAVPCLCFVSFVGFVVFVDGVDFVDEVPCVFAAPRGLDEPVALPLLPERV